MREQVRKHFTIFVICLFKLKMIRDVFKDSLCFMKKKYIYIFEFSDKIKI